MTHTSSHPSRPQLDGNRIAAETGAIAINAALLLLLLAPLTVPQLHSPPEREQTYDWLPRVKPKPVPPIEVPLVKQPPRAMPASTVVQPQQVEPQPAVIDPIGERVAPPDSEVIAGVIGNTIAPVNEPITGAQLQYAHAPPPIYPREAIRDGLTGTVLLQVLVDVDGKPLEVKISRSSGHRTLDQAARKQVLGHWRFVPAQRNGQAVQAIGLVPVDFALMR